MIWRNIAVAGTLVGLSACGAEREAAQPPEDKIEAKAEELDQAADRLPDPTQEQVLENQAEALREAAEGDAEVVQTGNVTVIRE